MLVNSLNSTVLTATSLQSKRAENNAQQKELQAQLMRQQYEFAQKQADTAQVEADKQQVLADKSKKSATEARQSVYDLQARDASLSTSSSRQNASNIASYDQSAYYAGNLTAYDLSPKAITGRIVNTTA